MNAKIMTRLSVFAVAGTLLAGCATQQQNNAAVGTGAGAALGAGLGAIFGGGKGAAIGAGVGALAGGITGYNWQAIRNKISGASKGTGTTVNEQGDGSLKVNIPATDAFAVNSAQISPSLARTLDEVANQMRQNPELVADVRGYTDITGGSELNQRLSQSRADAVAGYLSQRGVAPNRLAARGFGPADPVGDNNTEAGRAANRRVEVYLKALAQHGQTPNYQ
ncbi:OmpA family protein [Trinickia caryophylli]|uniref:Outer membrane protein OmpA n=1 Tax=Trinickia caryophylli TaxID=28094 RepID=A0A1X7GXR9_TRICW|nr:OmpA family protein [Trinickia caryophylli]PMS10146.1 OmpA family protein [Trinickia caryophylli]TRX18246.1 OmpA family protein [Trinickia caryophylli]WQE10967.1 OmpA family protein [Trinickia caryophylli]SMF76386.1 Outer membrane protein OmpA [Trinickia caryophylli]GLU35423.1 OmpA family lipoprotein [Trinickia caryophylli]